MSVRIHPLCLLAVGCLEKHADHLPLGTDYPEHYAGDANPATREKGLKLRQLIVDSLADYVRAVKRDSVSPRLARELYDRCDRIGS